MTNSVLDVFVMPDTETPAAKIAVPGEVSAYVYLSASQAIDIAVKLSLAAMDSGLSIQTGVILPVSEDARRARSEAKQRWRNKVPTLRVSLDRASIEPPKPKRKRRAPKAITSNGQQVSE
jgi:hypothetical protein